MNLPVPTSPFVQIADIDKVVMTVTLVEISMIKRLNTKEKFN